MKLIIDLSHTAHANWTFSASKGIGLWKHSILNSIASYVEQFEPEEVIIAADYRPTWREQVFPFYKIRKKKETNPEKEYFRDELYKFVNELILNIPWKVLFLSQCEADDIIAILARYFSGEEVIIISKDKDFKQLLSAPNIKIYDPRIHEFVQCPEPSRFLYNQILRGDAVDDIPNFLSDDDTFDIKGKRQKVLREDFINKMEADGYILDESFQYTIPESLKEFVAKKLEGKTIQDVLNNTSRNRKMIDFDWVPRKIKSFIIQEYKREKLVERKTTEEYFYKQGFLQIQSKINLFFREGI